MKLNLIRMRSLELWACGTHYSIFSLFIFLMY